MAGWRNEISGNSKEKIEDFAKKVIELIQNDESQGLAEII